MRLLTLLLTLLLSLPTLSQPTPAPGDHRYLYVATPGVRNYLNYGGHGLLVYDIDDNYALVKRIPTAGFSPLSKERDEHALKDADVLNVKGVCASAATGRLYISTLRYMECIDLKSEKQLWEKPYPGGADRMSITPDGQTIYLPSLEGDHWNVVNATTGDVITKITPKSGAHNTTISLDGRLAFLGGLKSTTMTLADARTHKPAGKIENFSNFIRPFTINGKATLAYVCVNDLLGFEIGDVATGQMIHRVQVEGFKKGGVKRHGCPSHGIALTPDEREVWLCDAYNKRLHIFDNTQMPPKQIANIELKDEPGWITFSLDGHHAYPSTGDIIDTKTRKIITTLKDENGKDVQSEKLIEIHWSNNKVTRTGDQFGLGRVTQ
jgi:DNA-binding beta-propeller fold protein YncE